MGTWMHVLAGSFLLTNLSAQLAGATDIDRTFYAGIGVFQVHHTMYDPNDSGSAAEDWVTGAKVFVGATVVEPFSLLPGVIPDGSLAIEGTYYYLNDVPIGSANPAISKSAESHALSLAALVSTQDYSHSMLPGPFRFFAKGGTVWKHITEFNTPGPIERESGFSVMVGGGVELDLPHQFRARMEYEFLHQIGTSRAIDLMHTPISISLIKGF